MVETALTFLVTFLVMVAWAGAAIALAIAYQLVIHHLTWRRRQRRRIA